MVITLESNLHRLVEVTLISRHIAEVFLASYIVMVFVIRLTHWLPLQRLQTIKLILLKLLYLGAHSTSHPNLLHLAVSLLGLLLSFFVKTLLIGQDYSRSR